jgi:hypothetical protein
MALVAVRGFHRSLGTGKSLSFVRAPVFMPTVTIKVFHSLDNYRELVRTIRVQSTSGKALSGSRALKILHQQFPELSRISSLVRAIASNIGEPEEGLAVRI